MTKIYEQHNKAFANVSAYVVLHGGERVATIALKFPRDGAGRLYAYVHWLGTEMVRGFAEGCGYDKRSAACISAARKLPSPTDDSDNEDIRNFGDRILREDFTEALLKDDGYDWCRRLEDAGFTVLQAV